jgi:NADH-quinone oxidoreductase subunit A
MEGWPLAIYFGLVVMLTLGMLVLSHFLGERHHDRFKCETYESGIAPTGSGRSRFSVKYYLVAMVFVIFDLEAVFIFAWAVAARDLGWAGYAEILVFIGVLLAALIYLWKRGALDWSATARNVSGSARRRSMYGREGSTE